MFPLWEARCLKVGSGILRWSGAQPSSWSTGALRMGADFCSSWSTALGRISAPVQTPVNHHIRSYPLPLSLGNSLVLQQTLGPFSLGRNSFLPWFLKFQTYISSLHIFQLYPFSVPLPPSTVLLQSPKMSVVTHINKYIGKIEHFRRPSYLEQDLSW